MYHRCTRYHSTDRPFTIEGTWPCFAFLVPESMVAVLFDLFVFLPQSFSFYLLFFGTRNFYVTTELISRYHMIGGESLKISIILPSRWTPHALYFEKFALYIFNNIFFIKIHPRLTCHVEKQTISPAAEQVPRTRFHSSACREKFNGFWKLSCR